MLLITLFLHDGSALLGRSCKIKMLKEHVNLLIEPSSAERFARYENKYASHQKKLTSNPVLSKVMDVGYCVIPNFWGQQQCFKGRQIIDDFLDPKRQQNIKIWKDQLGADQRILGINHLSPALNIFDCAQINQFIKALYGVSQLVGFSMAARINAVDGNKGSGQGWHRDSCIEHQYKAILYLSDVDKDNGPLEYYRHSGNAERIVAFEDQKGVKVDQNRLDQFVDKFDSTQIDTIGAKAGSLIVVNTRGIHRGRPLLLGNRYALTNYYWKNAIPSHITKNVNTI